VKGRQGGQGGRGRREGGDERDHRRNFECRLGMEISKAIAD